MNSDINSTKDIETTDLWLLYQRGINFNQLQKLYNKTNECWRFYHGNQWEGLKSGSIEPISYPIIEPIVNYKVANINQNLWLINYSSENFEDLETRGIYNKACDLLNKRASRVFERDQMDYKIRLTSRDSAVVGEGVIYVRYNEETNDPINEILDNTDVCFGNENSSDIQSQPYIILKLRRPVSEIRKMAIEDGVDESQLNLIMGDQDYQEQAGDSSKLEVNDRATLLIKLYKKDGTVHFDKATKNVVFFEGKDTQLSYYPLAHMIWKELKGSARGIGEVENTIPIQKEINKTAMRECLIVKMFAYPKAIVNTKMIRNYKDAEKVGVTLKTADANVEDVKKAFSYITPATMSGDASNLLEQMISKTRELKNASELATGNVNPENASGKAILAVQNASALPLNEYILSIKTFVEDLGRIYLDMWSTYAEEGLNIIDEVEKDGSTKEEIITITKELLNQLKASCKVDITPKSAYDKFAVEQSLENLLQAGLITLEEYVDSLDEDSVMPKQRLKTILKNRKKAEAKIHDMKMKAQDMMSAANNVVNTTDQINEIQAAGM